MNNYISILNRIYHIVNNMFLKEKIMLITISIWVLLQIIYVTLFRYDELMSDPGIYVYYAEECIKHGTMYPDYSNYHNEFIFNPGWVNFLILWIKIFGSTQLVPYFNILLNITIVYLLYKVAKITTESKTICYLVLYLFMIFPSFSTIALHLFTEIPFVVLTLLSTYLILTQRKWNIAIAGISIALAQWIRPLGIAWVIAAIFLMVFQNKRYKNILIYIFSIILTSGCIAWMTSKNFPQPVFQAQTGSVNLIMGANDKATGTYCGDARRSPDGLGYLPGLYDSTKFTRYKIWSKKDVYAFKYSNKYTYLEVDSIYKERALNWIKENPGKWFSLIPIKIYYLFECAPSFVYTLNTDYNNSLLLRILNLISFIIGRGFIFIILISFVGLVMPFWRNVKMIYILIPIVICTAMTVATCSTARYNLIILPFILIFSCNTLKLVYNKYFNK